MSARTTLVGAATGPTARAAGTGALAGLVAGLVSLLAVTLLRLWGGVPLPTELVSDRLLPQIGVDDFLDLLNRLGGAIRAKQIGYVGAFAGQLALAVALGALYGVLARRGRRAGAIVSGVALVLLAALLAILWPELDANYRGLSDGPARAATIAGLAVVFGLLVGTIALTWRVLTRARPAVPDDAAGAGGALMPRRALLVAGAGAVVAVAAGAGARALYDRGAFGYDGLSIRGGPGVPAITPTDLFYTVTKNLIDPQVDEGRWRLEVGGHVAHPVSLSLADLRAMEPVRQVQTLECISNSVGGGLISNAEWVGVPLAALIAEAAPRAGAVQAFLHGADGYTNGIDLASAMRRTTLLAYEMNGAPLDRRHGRPVRLLVPGSYGERSVKWITRVEIRADEAEGYYGSQGWIPAPVSTMSRFFTPKTGARVAAGAVRLEGAAFAGDRGISRVEVSTDGGHTWRSARLDYNPSPIAWTLWSLDWRAPRGLHGLVVRATDGRGDPQIAREQGIAPNGSKGLHRIEVTVA